MMIDIDTLLACGAAYKKVPAGEIIFMEGGQGVFYHQLVSGKVRWVNIDEQGREFLQNMVEPGESFGELPLFDDHPYAASAIADEDSLILRLHKSNFLKLLRDNQDLHFAFTKMITERLRYKFYFIKEIAYHDPENSVSKLIDYIRKTKKHLCPKCNRLTLTRQQIADMTGLRVETVIRTIRNLHDKGELTINKGKVYC